MFAKRVIGGGLIPYGVIKPPLPKRANVVISRSISAASRTSTGFEQCKAGGVSDRPPTKCAQLLARHRALR
jgi:hypothetical protein